MPSRPIDTGWDFGPVLDLIDSDIHVPSPPPPSSSAPRDDAVALGSPVDKRMLRDKTSSRSLHLGSFGKLFAELGISIEGPLSPISPPEPELEESSSSSDDAAVALFSEGVEALMEDTVRLVSPEKKSIPSEKSTPPEKSTSPEKKPISPKMRPVGETPEESSTNVTLARPATPPTPPSPTKESDSLMPSGLTKTQRKKWRRKQEKKRLYEELEELAEMTDTAEHVITQVLQQSDDSHPLPPRTHRMQTRAQSRSNVSAKIRPVSPIKAIPDVPMAYSPKPTIELPVTPRPVDKSTTPCPSNPYSVLFTMPKKSKQHDLAAKSKQPVPNTDMGYFPPQTPVQISKFQHDTFSTPVAQLGLPSPLVLQTAPQASSSIIHGHGLVPRTVQPVLVPRSQQPVATPQKVQHPVIQPTRTPFTPGKLPGPITIRPKVERNLHFFNQLVTNFPEELPWLVSPMQLCNDKAATEGIHVFVDASNIMIGFRFIMKKYRVAPFEISFDSLALLMERRRPVAKRVFAGSHREADPLPHVTKLQQVSKAVGYENNVIEQVYIRREETERRRFFKDVERIGFQKAVEKSQSRRGGNSSGSGSDSETGFANAANASLPAPTHSAPKWVEQGVDEILHLKMCQSIIDTEVPSTMVLATGDGAQAEHSDGFLAQVERALKKGWKVELVSWKLQTNGGYKNKRFRNKWGDNFKIIELDEYLEGLIDTP